MTEEELVNEANKWGEKNISLGVSMYNPKIEPYCIEAYLASAEPREKQIQIDAEQIRALQKQNGELTDELKLTNNECKNMREELKQRIRENQKLCEQIEKMKQELDNAREEANRQEQWELYSVLNGIYNDNFEVITSVSN